MLWVALLILVSLDLSASQHEYVRLLKPPSRIAENDVFIKRNAESPCPTIKTIKDNKTNIMIDDQYEIVWLNPNNIQGENRIELLNSNMQLLTLLNPILNQNYSNNNGISNINVQIPNSPCVNCIIRLVQSTADGDFQMISCADVDIVESISENKACYGNECLVECTTNEQCRKGICVQGACYCESGNYGINCSKESKILPSELNVDTFSSISPNSKNSLSWKIEQGNITIVLKFPVNAWTALGLRSLADHQKCSLLDTINKEFITTELLPTNSNKLVSEIVSNSSNHGGPIGICGENEQFSHCPELNRECEPSCDWTAFPESIPTCPRSCGTPRCVCKEGYVRIGNSKEACVPFNYCQAEIKVECQRNETWAKCGQACEPSCETMYDTTPCNTTCRNASCTCQDNYVRYNGKCIYWGDCPNLEQRLLTPSDHKSIENLTINVPPKEESFKVAEEVYTSTTIATLQDSKSQKPTLSQTNEIMHCALNETINECGKVCEADCVSIFIRDECKECGTPACSCIQGYARNNGACVYWGDCPLDISNLQSSLPIKALEEKTSIPNVQSTDGSITTIEFTTNPPKHSLENAELYNKTDSAEYISKNIQTNVSDVSGDYCYGEWRYPNGCKICDYKISWNFVEETDEIEFSLETKLNQNSWTGIGFSSLGGMRDADLIIVKSFNGKISLHDMYSNSYDVPAEDFENNILTPNIIGSHVDGVLRAQFTRKRDTGDRRMDHKFSDKKCYKFLFPVSGGKLDKNGQILKHEIVPIVTKQLVCIKSCQESPKNDDKFQEGSCSNEYKHPNGCELGKCEYTAKWEYNSSRREVYFEITSHGVGRWTGIGFSKTGKMENSDIYTGWVYGSKSFVIDRFAYGRQLPAIDPADRQDIYDIGGKLEDDYQTIWFKRKIVTPDQTTDFRLDECYYFMFPVGGGRVLARKGQDFQNAKTPIGYHDLYAPKVSQTKICICDENNKPIGFNDITPTAIRKRREAIPSDPFAENDMSDLSSNNSPVKNKEILLEEDPFACSDVIVAKVLDDGHSRVVDAFSLTKTGLEPDEFFGGKQTFTDIFASVINGIATVTIKRPAFSSDLADYSFKHEKTQLFWANGPIGAKSVKLNEAVSVESMIIDFYNSTKTNAPIVNSKSTTIMQTSSSPPQLDATSTLKTPLEVMHTTDTPTTLMEKMPQQTEPILTSGQFSSESEEELSHLLAVSKDPFIETSTIEMDHCYGYYNYPDNCQSDCSYQVDWRSDGSNVMFRLHAILYPEMWTGIGFSNDGTMINSDAVIVSLYKDGSVAVTDQFASSYGRPQVDQLQDIFDISTQYSNGHLWANFSRSLMTEDNNDLNLLDCLYFVFIQSGGQLEGGTAEIRKHLETPIHSASRICLNNCGGKNNFTSSSLSPSSSRSSSLPSTTTATTTTTLGATKSLPVQTTRFAKKDKEKILLSAGTLQVPPLNPPNRIAYDVIIRLLNKEYSPEFDDIDSQKSKILSQEIKKELSTLIRARWPTLESINILKFAKGSILSLIRLEFNGTNSEQLPKEDEIEEFLKAAAKEQIGSLTIDPLKLKVQRNLQSETDDKWAPLRDIRNWAIVGAALLLLTIIVLLLLCCSFRKSKRRIQPDPLSFSPPVHHGYPSYSVPEANSESTNQNLKNKANVNMLKKGQSAQNGDNNSPNSSNISEPNGIGNCTYQEWFTKVASKDTNSHIQENTYGSTMANARPMSRTSAQSSMTPYVSYPYDPVGYYTLNGEHRLPPPAYYRHY